MDDQTLYSITLADGTILDNLRMNGNNYIYQGELDYSIFDGNLSPVKISNGEDVEIHEHMELVKPYFDDPGKTWFVLLDIPESELRYAQTRSDIMYLSMMTGVDL